MNKQNLLIYQPFLNQEQLELVDPLFVALNHTKNPQPLLREYPLFKEIFQNLKQISADYIGLFSIKFSQKTFLSGVDVQNFINKNPGYDVYLFNPFPQNSDLFYTIWEEAEYQHPGITQITKKILELSQTKVDLTNFGRTPQQTVYCNFWVGSKTFWNKYFSFLIPIAENMIAHPETYLVNTSYYHGPLPFFPFIVERLVTTFLVQSSDIKYKSYVFPNSIKETLFVHQYQREVHKIVQPLTQKLDKLYGDKWPKDAQVGLSNLRSLAFKISDDLNYDKTFLC